MSYTPPSASNTASLNSFTQAAFNTANNALPLTGGTLTGQVTFNGVGNGIVVANNATVGGALTVNNNILLSNSISNIISFNSIGANPPSYTTRSSGTKIVIWPSLTGTSTDYAIGVDSNVLWTNLPQSDTSHSFKWYAGTSSVATLDGIGNLTISGNVSGTIKNSYIGVGSNLGGANVTNLSAYGAGGIGWNYTNGGAEIDFFNFFTGFTPHPSYVWYQYANSSGTYTANSLMSLDPNNGLTVYGPLNNQINGISLKGGNGTVTISSTGTNNTDIVLVPTNNGIVKTHNTLRGDFLSARGDLLGGKNLEGLPGSGEGISSIFASTGVLYGNTTSAISPFSFNITGDNTSNGGTGLSLNYNWGGNLYKGGSTGMIIQLQQTSSINNNPQQVGLCSWLWGNYNCGGTSYSNPSGYLYGFNPQVVLSGGNYWNLANAWGEGNINIASNQQTLTIGGSVTPGDVLTVTFTGATIVGSPVSISYTVPFGASLAQISSGICHNIYSNQNLYNAGIKVFINPDVNPLLINIGWDTLTTISVSTSAVGATETLTLGAFKSGASVRDKVGLTIVRESGDVQIGGSYNDSAIVISTQINPANTGWQNGISLSPTFLDSAALIFGDYYRSIGGSNRGGFITPHIAKYGVRFDYVNFTKSNGYSLLMPGFSVSGNGTIQTGISKIIPTNSGVSIDTTGYTSNGTITITNGGGGGTGNIQFNYYVNDLIYDNYGGQYSVLSTNTQTGAVTSLTTLVPPYSYGSNTPNSTITTFGGSGIGLTINVGWQIANTLSLNPSGGHTTIGGNLTVNGSITSTILSVNSITTTSYTLSTTDSGKVLTFNNTSPITVTVTNNLPVGFRVQLTQINRGSVKIQAAANVTLNPRIGSNNTLLGIYSSASIFSYAANTFIIDGSIS